VSEPPNPLATLETATKAYGPRPLLDGVSLGVAAGDRIGVVGRNGAGKTTLLEALAGRAELDSGRATRARGLRLGYLPQAEDLAGEVAELVFGSLPEHEWATDLRSRSVIAALLSGIDLNARAERMSGGERRRVALATLLRSDHDLLLLDEPTNHLDIEAIRWLAGYLRDHGRAFVVVTHDRWFLDAVTERTWEVADGRVHSYEGGYSAYVLARTERARIAEAADQRRRNLLRKELAWLRRGPPARTSKPKFRIEAATALIEGEPAPRDSVELSRLATARLGKTVIEVEDATVRAGQRTLLDDVTWRLGPGERVGVVGVNGSGKTTLLRLLAGDLPKTTNRNATGSDAIEVTGRVVRGKTVRIGYLEQEPPAIDPGLRALEAAEQVRRSVRIGDREIGVGRMLDRLGLRGDRQWVPVDELSGGERRRLQLMMVLLDEPNVLLLDEPTNDLDIDTLTELEDLLDGWPGSMVVVSHDRYFLERVTDHVVALLDGTLPYLPGGVEEYLDRIDRQRGSASRKGRGAAWTEERATKERATREGGASEGGMGRRVGPRRRAGDTASRPAAAPGSPASAAARQRAARKELDRLERQLDRVSGQEADLAAALAEHASDYAKLIELGAQMRAVQEQKAGLEDRWLTVAEEISG
jgi:ABC transport system ATP-binding/permease protein